MMDLSHANTDAKSYTKCEQTECGNMKKEECINTLIGLSQKFKVGLALEKHNICIKKEDLSVRYNHIKRNLSISDVREKNFFSKVQYPFVILKRISVKDESILKNFL